MKTVMANPALTGSPSLLFAATWFFEALAATQRSFTETWHSIVFGITPAWLARHRALISALKQDGVTSKYALPDIKRFKRHVVATRSDPYWKLALVYRSVLRWLLPAAHVAASVVGFAAAGFFIGRVCIGAFDMLMVYTLALGACTTGIIYASTKIDDYVQSKVVHPLNFRSWVYWRQVSFREHVVNAPPVPRHVERAVNTTSRIGGHVLVDEAKTGDVYVDPFLYVSAVPMWVSSIPGLSWLRLCVYQWGDKEFESGGFADRAKRLL